jgi:hypothetical protein
VSLVFRLVLVVLLRPSLAFRAVSPGRADPSQFRTVPLAGSLARWRRRPFVPRARKPQSLTDPTAPGSVWLLWIIRAKG